MSCRFLRDLSSWRGVAKLLSVSDIPSFIGNSSAGLTSIDWPECCRVGKDNHLQIYKRHAQPQIEERNNVALMHVLLETCAMDFMSCVVILCRYASIHRLNLGRIPTMSAHLEGRFTWKSMFQILTAICCDSKYTFNVSSAGIFLHISAIYYRHFLSYRFPKKFTAMEMDHHLLSSRRVFESYNLFFTGKDKKVSRTADS